MSTVSPSDPTTRLLPTEPVPDLQTYVAGGGGRGLSRAVERDPDDLIAEIEEAGLRGRGGAGFSTGLKWRSIVDTARDQDLAVAVVVNGAEGEPGTYKDRALLLANPYQVVEGLLIACSAVGASAAFVGLKSSFAGPRQRLEDALAEAVAADWPGAQMVQIVSGPDEYLFGEETAMLEVIEGNLPFPRHLAPYVNGLFTQSAHPSVALVNNVETLANVPLISASGASSYRQLGTEQSPGTMLFTVVGDVTSAGVYELPLGTPLRVLLSDIAGATDIKAAFSGVSNAIITPAMLDTPLDYESMVAAGSGQGSGGFIVYDSSHCIVRVTATLARFLSVESCGQCNACTMGTGAIHEILQRIDAGQGRRNDLEALGRWAAQVTDLARCGLPVGPQVIVASLLTDFESELVDHLDQPCWSERTEIVPKIEYLDLATGVVTYDRDYHRKRSDWTYADA